MIEVEDAPGPKPGKCLVIALIGPTGDVFEIYEDLGKTHYYVNHTPVDAQTYRDCLDTADKDRFCPGCASGEHGSDEHEHEEHMS